MSTLSWVIFVFLLLVVTNLLTFRFACVLLGKKVIKEFENAKYQWRKDTDKGQINKYRNEYAVWKKRYGK